MTYLPGTDDAIYPGTDRIIADAFVEDDSHLVVLDLSPVAYPLDGLIATLARTLSDVGLLDAFCTLGRNRSAHPVVHAAMDALRSESSIARLLQITLTPDDAVRLRDQLDEAQVEPEKCRYPRCTSYRVDSDHCGPHIADDYPRAV